jgi:hypothetical protein
MILMLGKHESIYVIQDEFHSWMCSNDCFTENHFIISKIFGIPLFHGPR